MKRQREKFRTEKPYHSAVEDNEVTKREARRAFEAQCRRETKKTNIINDRLFGPPIPIEPEQCEKIRRIFLANNPTSNEKTARKKISLTEYRNRRSPPVEFIVTLPDTIDQIQSPQLLQAELFTNEDIIHCVRAAISTLPPHIAPAFTVSDYLWPKPLSVKPIEKWACNIIGFDPFIPPPVRPPPSFKLKDNLAVTPASPQQFKFWLKNWSRLENIILNDVRIYLEVMVRQIMVQLTIIRQKSKQSIHEQT